ncbi:MAG: RNA polymerase sigma factor [Actinomycetota bacterium]
MKRQRVQELVSLYVNHFGAAKRFAYLLTGDESSAEVIAQEAFVRMFSALTRIKTGAALPAYLRRVIVNLANDRGRRQSRE